MALSPDAVQVASRRRIEACLRRDGVRLVPKTNSRLMVAAGLLLRAIGHRGFIERYWTTIARTIYFPTSVIDPLSHWEAIEHELVHVRQWKRWNILLWLTYLLLPVPFGLAWFRWYWEREAYLMHLHRAGDREREIERIISVLWSGYGWPWPRRWMRCWFRKQVTSPRTS